MFLNLFKLKINLFVVKNVFILNYELNHDYK